MSYPHPIVPEHPLDSADVAALRMADEVAFEVREGRAHIRAGVRWKKHRTQKRPHARVRRCFPVLEGNRASRTIPCLFHVSGNGPEERQLQIWTHWDAPDLTASTSVRLLSEDSPWSTIARAVRSGDILWMQWTADVAKGDVRDAGFHVDKLVLRVKRGSLLNSYLIAVAVGRDNPTRMIRRNIDLEDGW